jgi:hypothetical protein
MISFEAVQYVEKFRLTIIPCGDPDTGENLGWSPGDIMNDGRLFSEVYKDTSFNLRPQGISFKIFATWLERLLDRYYGEDRGKTG